MNIENIPILDEVSIFLTKEEIIALLKELENTYISPDNPIAIQVIQRMIKFRNEQLY